MAVSKEEILETIGNMTVLEVVDLISAMEEKFGVTAAAAVAAAPVAAAGEAQVEEVKDEFNVVMTSPTPRTTINRVSATSGGLTESDSQSTEWRAVPGIRTNIIDDVDPIRVGDTVVYTLSVLNQSPLEPLQATVVVKFPAEVDAVSVGEGVGGTVVNSKRVEFQPVTLRPRQEQTMTIQARGARTGNATVIMETKTNFRDDAVIDQESTTVY